MGRPFTASDDEVLRAAGVSYNKIKAMKDLAAKTLDGTIPSHAAIRRMSDADIVERLTEVRGIGPWTVEMLALYGQGRHDQVPAGDVGLLKLVGRALSGGDPYARAQEQEVREHFAPYGEWAGLAAVHAMSTGG